MDDTTWLVAVLVVWPLVGVATAVALRRRGHDLFSWVVLGVAFGPLTIPLALAVVRREGTVRRRVLAAGLPGEGPLAVLVGSDGSPESEDALAGALVVLGPRIGRLTLARVVDFEAADEAAGEASRDLRREAEEELAGHAAGVGALVPETVILGGDPAEALAREAAEAGYDVLVVGQRGRGLSEALLGSTASHLVRRSPVPVMVGGAGTRGGGG